MTTDYFADNLRTLRLKRGYTQAQMSDLLHIQRQTYCNYENGRRNPSIEMLIAISNLFNVSIDTLVKAKISIVSKDIWSI